MPKTAPPERKPDFEEFLKVLRCEAPSRPVLGEMFMGWDILHEAAGFDPTDGDPLGNTRMEVEGYRKLGYDYAMTGLANLVFARGDRHKEKSVSLNEGALITDRASFDAYAWPDPDTGERVADEELAAILPDGMKFITRGPGGVLENVIGLTGFDTLCFLLVDDPGLAKDIFDAVGSRLLRYHTIAANYDSVGAILSNDDWGFKTQTMLTPNQMREYVFPWHRQFVAAAHAAGKPTILHSCGNLEEVFEDVIEDMCFDGKHSYEDTILPVEDTYERWGARIAIIGGIDVDFLCRSTAEQVHKRAKAMLERTAARGGYALGSGNSIPDYIPRANYYAMVSAAWE